MNYTKKYTQASKAAAKAKYSRMASSMGRTGSSTSFECGFSTWWVGKDIESDEAGIYQDDPEYCTDYAIFVSTNYHPETTLDNMYKSNCKSW